MTQSSGTTLVTSATAALGCGRVAAHAQGVRRDLDNVESGTVDSVSRPLPA